MIIQRDKPIQIWGSCDPGEWVTVQVGEHTQRVQGNKAGEWRLIFPARKAGPAFSIIIAGQNTIRIDQVLAGEVWLCSGQSNMEWPVSLTQNAEQLIATANYPEIRSFEVEKKTSLQPESNWQKGRWVSASPATVGRFTAIGYLFALQLYKELNVPIGIVNASIGGTHIETWMSGQAIKDPIFGNIYPQIPTKTIAELIAEKQQAMLTKIREKQGGIPPSYQRTNWLRTDYNDRHWPLMKVPGYWEPQGWENLNGKVWYRLAVTIPAEWQNKTVTLELGQIDDSDSVWVNGQLIGYTRSQPLTFRKYQIPAQTLQTGKNTMVIMVDDTGGGGGFISRAGSMFLACEGQKISIEGDVPYQISDMYNNGFQVYPNDYPTLLYNAMIHPLQNFGIRGFVWYQGESNTSRAEQYASSFPLMIKDWRQQWGDTSLPFLFVQLSSFDAGTTVAGRSSTWAELRQAQEQALALPNTYRAVTIDVGNTSDIHPRNKQTVAQRLAACALNRVYQKLVPYESPVLKAYEYKNNGILIKLSHTESGLLIKDSTQTIKGFEIAAAGKDFIPALVRIEGNDLFVYHPSITQPEAVRYAWKDDAGDANVFNRQGFPLAPFRTDNRSWRTAGKLYQIGR